MRSYEKKIKKSRKQRISWILYSKKNIEKYFSQFHARNLEYF